MALKRKPLRILQILRAPIGGLYRHVVDLATGLALRGHELGLVMDANLSDAQTETRLEALTPFLKLGLHKFPISRTVRASDLTTAWRIRQLAAQLNIDVVHGHGAKGGLNARIAGMGAANRVAFYTPHGGVLHYSPKSLVGKIFRRAEIMLLPQTDTIIFESQFSHDAFVRQIARPDCQTPVIHNGLDKAEFTPVPSDTDARDFVFIGELRALKGVHFLLEALVERTNAAGKPATLIMAGGGPSRGDVEAKIVQLGLQHRVHLAGVQPARAMLAKGQCLVAPSLAESLPYAILEAAAANKPVIATNVGGIKEIFGPTAEHLVPAADANALGIAMQAFLDNPPAARAEAERRRDYVHATFTLEQMLDGIQRAYFDALKAK